jgi:hypothetical protein
MGTIQSTTTYNSLVEKNRSIEILRKINDIKSIVETRFGETALEKVKMVVRCMEYSYQLQEYISNSDLEDKTTLLNIIADSLKNYQ